MYKFPLILLFVLLIGSCAITQAENLVLGSAVLDEMPQEIKNSDFYFKQLYVDEKKSFENKVSEKKNKNPKVQLKDWKKVAPSAQIQKDGIEVVQ